MVLNGLGGGLAVLAGLARAAERLVT